MAEYSSKLELCSFGLTKSFIPLGFVKNTTVFPLGFVIFEPNIPLGFVIFELNIPLGFVIFELNIPLGFIRNDNKFLCILKENVYFRTVK